MMREEMQPHDLQDRLNLIETMIAEGRRTTESWGWAFIFWGVAYYVAMAWAAWGHSYAAWPVTMIVAVVVSSVVGSRQAHKSPATTMARSIGAVWIAMGISLFLLLFSLGLTGRADPHVVVAIIGAMLGMTNATSSIILRWKMQFACAVVWWASAVLACFGTEKLGQIAFVVAIFFCQIVFGTYSMFWKSRLTRQGASHA
jgi:hypothetical protein